MKTAVYRSKSFADITPTRTFFWPKEFQKPAAHRFTMYDWFVGVAICRGEGVQPGHRTIDQQSRLSVILLQVSAIEGRPLSGVPLYSMQLIAIEAKAKGVFHDVWAVFLPSSRCPGFATPFVVEVLHPNNHTKLHL